VLSVTEWDTIRISLPGRTYMNDSLKQRYILEVEPERYELFAAPAYDFAVTRRDLWKLLGAGLLLTLTEPPAAGFAPVTTRIHVAENGQITLLTGKVDMGQGLRTLLTQVAAEELRTATSAIRLVTGDTGLAPDDGGTWGSLTTPETVPLVRSAAVRTRQKLIEIAAAKWSIASGELVAEDGRVRDAAGRTFSYGELAGAGIDNPKTAHEAPPTPPAGWRICGTDHPAVLGREIVTGALRYSSDQRVPGMLHGALVRPPGHRATLLSYTAPVDRALENIRVVRDGDLLGAVAADEESARRAVSLIQAEWRTELLVPFPTLMAHFKKTAKPPQLQPGSRYPAIVEKGNVPSALERSHTLYSSSYSLSYIAHAPLETRSAIAEWSKDAAGEKLTVRYAGQAPFLVRKELAEAFRLPEDRVRVISGEIGGAYGGKQRGEVALEAARLAKAAGAPVRVHWTREDEFRSSYFRPAGFVEVTSGCDARGKIVAWDFHNYNSGASSLAPPYAIADYYCGYHRSDSPLRQGSYRSLAAVANTFAREMHIAELADLHKTDPLEFRLRNLDSTRMRTVLERAAERFDWGRGKSGNGTGYGLACNLEKEGHLAVFVEVETNGRRAQVRKMTAAADFGAILNPSNLRNQIDGALIQGIGGALFERIDYDEKNVRNASFSEYRVPRFSDTPEIEVILIDRRDIQSAGAGEAPITLAAPAIGSALHAATGRWFRSMPMFG